MEGIPVSFGLLEGPILLRFAVNRCRDLDLPPGRPEGSGNEKPSPCVCVSCPGVRGDWSLSLHPSTQPLEVGGDDVSPTQVLVRKGEP